jgi:hypothetical protein
VVRGWGAEEDVEVSNGVSKRGFEPTTRDTLDGVEIEIPIPDHHGPVSLTP